MNRLRHALWPLLLLVVTLGAAPQRAPAATETTALAHAHCAETEEAEPCAVALCCLWIAAEARVCVRETTEPPPRPLREAFAASTVRAPPSPPPRLG